jgi:TRAP-type mannitol/chloroaromatic compound transport system substrate-binding protein
MLEQYMFKSVTFTILSCFMILTGCSENKLQIHHWELQSQALPTSIDYLELEVFTKNVALMSSGRLVINPHPAGELAHGADIFNAVSENVVQMGNGWPNWWSAQHPSWAVMNAGPFDFMNLDASMMFFMENGGIALANELSLPKGVLWRPAWWAGMEFGLTSKKPIKGLDDLKGKKVRIGPGLPSEVLTEAADSISIPLVPEEIRVSLENNSLDAVEWTTAAGVLDLGLHDLSPYGIVPAIWQPSVLADFLINKQAYDKLSPDLRAILETAIKSYTLTTTLKAKTKDIESLKKFKALGMTLRKWSDEDIVRWRKASDKIITEYKKRDNFSKRLIEQKQDFKHRYDEYYELFGSYE